MNRSIFYLFALIPAIIVISGNLIGGHLAWGNTVYALVFLVLADYVLPSNKNNAEGNTKIADVILVATVMAHLLCIGTLCWKVFDGTLTGWYLIGAVLSTGVNSGTSGIVSAHELVHRKEKWLRQLGILNMFVVNYGHWYVEHIRGHHKYVGTERDPATARKGESVYYFILRTIPQQFLSSWHLEKEKLTKKQKKWFDKENFVLWISILELIVCFSFLLLSPIVALVYLLQSIVAVFLLEYVNYIEHYGLVRNETEKFGPQHAWQSDLIASRYTLIELSRHSDHHMRASKEYQTLITHGESPEMPSGYFGMFYVALIPPLWFKLVHKALADYQNKAI
jgi:alkane 1-monooxygenase